MTKLLYYRYWGKADEPLKVAYCPGMDKETIFIDFKKRIAGRLRKSESELQTADLDKLANKEKWEYKQTDYAPYQLLPYHCLDVVAVAICWWESSKSLSQQFTQTMQAENEQQAKAWVMFFVTLHDLGKLDICFQCKAQTVVKQLQPDIKSCLQETYYHGSSSYACFLEEMKLYGIGFLAEDGAREWMQQVAGHHGVIPEDGDYIAPAFVDEVFKKRDQQARIDWINDLKQLFQVDLDAVPKSIPPHVS